MRIFDQYLFRIIKIKKLSPEKREAFLIYALADRNIKMIDSILKRNKESLAESKHLSYIFHLVLLSQNKKIMECFLKHLPRQMNVFLDVSIAYDALTHSTISWLRKNNFS